MHAGENPPAFSLAEDKVLLLDHFSSSVSTGHDSVQRVRLANKTLPMKLLTLCWPLASGQ